MSKKYDAAKAKIEAGKTYAPLAALALVKEIHPANFDETVEAHFRLGIDTRQADQQLRGTVSLPNGSGKTVRVAVFAEGDAARAAEEAGQNGPALKHREKVPRRRRYSPADPPPRWDAQFPKAQTNGESNS